MVLESSEEIQEIMCSAVILENDKLLKVITAIHSSENKRMTDEEIQILTRLDMESVVGSIELLDKSDYITTIMEERTGRSLHKVCQLTSKGERFLRILEINA